MFHRNNTNLHTFSTMTLCWALSACNTTTLDPAVNTTDDLTNQSEVASPSAALESTDDCQANQEQLLSDLLALLNATRGETRQCGTERFSATGALGLNEQLTQAARNHSDDMAEHNFFSHTGSDGRSADGRIDDSGYQWTAIGENIAGGQTRIESVVRDWLSSPGHCANIMRADYTEVGLSCRQNESADLQRYWTAVFARPIN